MFELLVVYNLFVARSPNEKTLHYKCAKKLCIRLFQTLNTRSTFISTLKKKIRFDIHIKIIVGNKYWHWMH